MSKVITLFEVIPTQEGKARYLELAANLKNLINDVEGFIRAERFQSLANENKILSLNEWENEECMAKWRKQIEHRMSQFEGKDDLFESYKITVVSVIREYSHENREQAPQDSNDYIAHNTS